jgi:hypothetical protein
LPSCYAIPVTIGKIQILVATSYGQFQSHSRKIHRSGKTKTRIVGKSMQTIPVMLSENSTLVCGDLQRIRGKHEIFSADFSAQTR